MSTQVVWFKRDLRVHDHLPLQRAAATGPCVFLYIYEPELLHSPEFDPSHLIFINQSLRELDVELRARGTRLTLRVGEATEVFDRLHQALKIDAIWSHQETGNLLTFARDKRVAQWARRSGVAWIELPNHGVFRGLETRDGWARRWRSRMERPLTVPPGRIQSMPQVDPGQVLSAQELGLENSQRVEALKGGWTSAQELLTSFLDERALGYEKNVSSPTTAWSGCSRLSPYLAWGNVSMRQVYQATRQRVQEVLRADDQCSEWRASLKAFEGRLHWHCHFIQKLEDQPSIELENINRAFDGLREDEFDQSKFQAWCSGQTGYPLVDACMRALHRGGWINFRMRAMLVSFACHHLWLHWRQPSTYLARLFLDFEPGIHYSQIQMQAGVTGINAVRIYSPTKQARDHDPRGVFIRRYCPELTTVPDEYIAEPHRMPAAVQSRVGCIIGRHYPKPIVEHRRAYDHAKRRLYAVRSSEYARREAAIVYRKHGSRRRAQGVGRNTAST